MNLQHIKTELEGLTAADGLRWVGSHFGAEAKFSTSFGVEDQLLTYLIASQHLPIAIFTLDTGRMFQETYDTMQLTLSKYKVPIATYFPEAEAVEKLVATKGPNSFYESVENRKECCSIRKVLPLKRALQGAKVWITGVRGEQSVNRQAMEIVAWDDVHQLVKYNPLLDWTTGDIEAAISQHKVPVNPLHRKGYPSIGCAPCTRAIAPGEDPRAGRWWWESSAKECGLHSVEVKEVGNNK